MKHIRTFIFVALATVLLHACSPAGGEFTGSEYIPDMAHSIAYEANTYNYYYYNTWDQASTFKLKDLTRAGKPVPGTMPRGYAGIYYATSEADQIKMIDHLRGRTSTNAISIPLNGNVPYYYGDTEEERLRATEEILINPFPITTAGLAKGKELYGYYCGICHGDSGNGMGYLVSDDNKNVVYPAQPAILTNEEFSAASNGRYYHAIMYGKNVMGGYADKLSFEERWQVIHYIRTLQAKEAKLVYDAKTNTFNPAFGTPGESEGSAIAQGPVTDETPPAGEGSSPEEETESEDHDGEH